MAHSPNTPTKRVRDRKVQGTDKTTVLLEQMPRQLIEDAKTKCRGLTPPTTLKQKVIELLQGWIAQGMPPALKNP